MLTEDKTSTAVIANTSIISNATSSVTVNTITNTEDKPTIQDNEDQPTGAKRPRLELDQKKTIVNNEIMISQGAEAIVTKMNHVGRCAVRKHRLIKRYRHPTLDSKLRSRRLSQEARILLRLRKYQVPVPAIYDIDTNPNHMTIIMQFVPGKTLKQFLTNSGSENEKVMKIVGNVIAKMHKADVVHGDLTTSNIMITDIDTVTLIDFGLSFGSGTDEDFAVDLYVFERAVIATHSEHAQVLNHAFFEQYQSVMNKRSVMKKLEEVRARGRKRDMVG